MKNAEVKLKTKKSKKSFKQRLELFLTQWQLQAMVIPGILFMFVFTYIPIYGLSIAFKHYTVIDNIKDAPWVGLENFRIILSDKYFMQAVVNTLGISLLKLALGFFVPIILAIMIYEVKAGPFKKIVQTISYLPHFLSWIILGGMLISWMSTNGLYNQILMSLGIIEHGSNHLLDANKYWMIAVLSDIWKEVGWGTILYLATMSRIDPTYYEAARIDGANKFSQIKNITLPMLVPIISLNLILNISGLLNSNLDQTLVLMNSQNGSRSEVINSYVYRMGLAQGDFSYATAVGLGISVISIILLFITNKVTKKMNNNQSVIF